MVGELGVWAMRSIGTPVPGSRDRARTWNPLSSSGSSIASPTTENVTSARSVSSPSREAATRMICAPARGNWRYWRDPVDPHHRPRLISEWRAVRVQRLDDDALPWHGLRRGRKNRSDDGGHGSKPFRGRLLERGRPPGTISPLPGERPDLPAGWHLTAAHSGSCPRRRNAGGARTTRATGSGWRVTVRRLTPRGAHPWSVAVDPTTGSPATSLALSAASSSLSAGLPSRRPPHRSSRWTGVALLR